MSTATLIDGVECDLVTVTDRGLQFGDGLFETMKCIDGAIPFWKRHFERLEDGARRLGIDCPEEQVLHGDLQKLLLGATRDCAIKIMLTRGSSERGYATDRHTRSRRIVRQTALPVYAGELYEHGIAAIFCTHRLSSNPVLAGIKHLNRLDNVIARRELGKREHEGVVSDQRGNVIEGTMSNLFIVKNNALYTAALTDCGVNGIIRRLVLEIAAKQGLDCHVTEVAADDLRAADELFFCNSLIGIWPVGRLQEHTYTVGAVTRALMQRLHAAEKDDVHNI